MAIVEFWIDRHGGFCDDHGDATALSDARRPTRPGGGIDGLPLIVLPLIEAAVCRSR